MKKALVFSFVIVFGFSPLSAHAIVNSINGQSALTQFLVTPGSNATNTMHMEIIQVGADTHRFRWDGSPWRVDQGGTGLSSSPLFGQLLLGDGNGGYALTSTSSLGLVPYAGATEGLDLGTNDLSAAALKFNGDLVFGGASLNLIDSESGFEINLSIPSPQTLAFPGNNGIPGILDFSLVSTSAKIFTFPDVTGTLGLLEADQIWTGENQFNSSTIFSAEAEERIDLTSNDLLNLSANSALSVYGGQQVSIHSQDLVLISSGNDITLNVNRASGGEFNFSAPTGGVLATTTINFGEITDTLSRSCFNTKNTDGQDISFYFSGTTMVVENNVCR